MDVSVGSDMRSDINIIFEVGLIAGKGADEEVVQLCVGVAVVEVDVGCEEDLPFGLELHFDSKKVLIIRWIR